MVQECTPLIVSIDNGPLTITRSNRWGILAGIWVATFLASLNTTMVATLLTSISSEFQSANSSTWLGTSYLLATASMTPLYGRLSNVLGRRGANQLALVLLGLGTIGCGFARSMRGLILVRFVVQIPFYFFSFALTQYYLRYPTPHKSRSTLSIISSIDYLGTLFLLLTLSLSLFSLSNADNSDIPFSNPSVWACALGAIFGAIGFLVVELRVAREPILEAGLLGMKIPLLVGVNSFLVPLCNFSVMYFFPMWFEIVAGTTSSEAGLHLLPNSISMSLGSLFAGYMMHRTGRYKTLNLVFGILPFIAACLIVRSKPDSGIITQWLSIIPLGFGNAVVLQTTLIALLVAIPPSQLAVGTGFVQLFRGIGQVLGVSVPSAFFQTILQKEFRARLVGEGAEKMIQEIRHNSRVVKMLPEELQVKARAAFAVSFKAVFIFSAVCTLSAFIVRLGIPEQSLDEAVKSPASESDSETSEDEVEDEESAIPSSVSISHGTRSLSSSDGHNTSSISITSSALSRSRPTPIRRLSTYETEYGVDPESVGGSSELISGRRQRSSSHSSNKRTGGERNRGMCGSTGGKASKRGTSLEQDS